MNTKKALGATGLLATLLAIVILAPWGGKRANAVTDTCSGVATEFNATAPASVVAGQAFTLSGITSTPTTSYGLTITSSTLNLSATGATPNTYSQQNTSTDPSPTTGAPTYTAYYPNWALTATGAAGSQIVIKLVQATATVSEVGQTITCPLTATLATINVTAPASGSSGSSTPTKKPSSTPTPTTTTPQSTTPSPTTTTPSPATSSPSSPATKDTASQVVTMKILVVNGQKHPIKDVPVTIDGQLTAKTAADGIASFKDIRKGVHTASIDFGKQKLSKQVEATATDKPTTTFVVSTGPSMWLLALAGLGVLLLLGATLFVITVFRRKRH